MSDNSGVDRHLDQRAPGERWLWAPVDNDWLIFFRVVFGGVMLYWVARYCVYDLVNEYFAEPRYHFHYFNFEWVRPWPRDWMQLQFYGLGLCAVMIIVGCFYRLAALLFALGFTHVFLIDKCYYLNHYYLVCLLAWLMVVLPANRAASLDAIWRPQIHTREAPVWSLWLVRFQIGIPYLFGGIAKLNPDWLAGEPMRMMLHQRASYPMVGPFFTEEWCVQFFVWGGLLFDLLAVPLLLWSRTRPFAFVVAICFHLTNAWLFTIGIFPWFMILATVVYFPPGCMSKLLALERIDPNRAAPNESTIAQKLLVTLLLLYVGVQVVVPFRHFLQAGNPSWTEEGHYFSWHMMIRGKKSALRYYATDTNTGRTGTIDLREYVTSFQLNRCSRDPRMIHELSQIIAAHLGELGFPGLQIRALSLVSMNGRKPQLMIDPNVDLAAERPGWRQPGWIVPLREPLREQPWDLPVSEWEQALALP